MIHYLQEIYKIWSTLFPHNFAARVDAPSVKLAQGMVSCYSIVDQSNLAMLVRDRSLFPGITLHGDRDRLLQGLLSIPGRILSLDLFFKDAICFAPLARGMRSLLPPRSKESVRNLLLHCWNERTAGNMWCLQVSENEFKNIRPDQGSPDEIEAISFWMSYVQLWLVIFRHFVDPRRGRKKPQRSIQPLFEIRGEVELEKAATKLTE
jgi:Protein of unknown function (DUF3723)